MIYLQNDTIYCDIKNLITKQYERFYSKQNKVFSFASCIAKSENLTENEIQIVEIAAILHDTGIKKSEQLHKSSAAKFQEQYGPGVANELLIEFDLDNDISDRIKFIIANHHTYNAIDGIDFQIVVEADFLVNIFEDNMQKKSIENIYHKFFKTKTGISMIENMYLRS